MKIIFIVGQFPPYIGSVSGRVYRIAQGLSQKGHEINVHTAFHPKAPRVEKIGGIKVERHYDLRPRVARFLKKPLCVKPGLFKLFSEEEILKADVI